MYVYLVELTFLSGSDFSLRKVKALVTAEIMDSSRAFPRDLYSSFSFRVKAWNENISVRALSHDNHMNRPFNYRTTITMEPHYKDILACIDVHKQDTFFSPKQHICVLNNP